MTNTAPLTLTPGTRVRVVSCTDGELPELVGEIAIVAPDVFEHSDGPNPGAVNTILDSDGDLVAFLVDDLEVLGAVEAAEIDAARKDRGEPDVFARLIDRCRADLRATIERLDAAA